MKKRYCHLFLLALLVWQFRLPADAEQLLMARSVEPFPEAMLDLQESIRAHGYAVTRVQRVDVGPCSWARLTRSGRSRRKRPG